MPFAGKKVLLFSVLFPALAFGGGIKSPGPQNLTKFTENKHQWERPVLYRAQLDGGALFLGQTSFTYNFYDKETYRANHAGSNASAVSTPVRSHAFRMSFAGAAASAIVSAKNITPDYCNYFIGKDRRKWAGGARNFREINYHQLIVN